MENFGGKNIFALPRNQGKMNFTLHVIKVLRFGSQHFEPFMVDYYLMGLFLVQPLIVSILLEGGNWGKQFAILQIN